MLRIHQSQRFDVDDGFLALAVVTLCASAGVLHAARNLIYVQVRLSLGLITAKTPALLNELLYYHKLEETASVLLWISIFAVKFAFLFFFRSLIQRVRPLEVWWFVVVGVMVLAACTCIPLGFMVCPDFSYSFLSKSLDSSSPAKLQRRLLNTCRNMSRIGHSPTGNSLPRHDGLHRRLDRPPHHINTHRPPLARQNRPPAQDRHRGRVESFYFHDRHRNHPRGARASPKRRHR